MPGDLVVLTSGDRVPADLRLIAVKDRRVDEAALTGESLPVEKITDAVAPAAPLGDRFGTAYSGTLVVHGQATGLVVATGGATELGALDQFLCELQRGTAVETARTMAVNAVVVAEMFYLLNSRRIFAPAVNRAGLSGNRIVWLAIAACVPLQAAFTHLPAMQGVFGSADLGAVEWLKVVGAGFFVFSMAELEKLVIRGARPVGRLGRA